MPTRDTCAHPAEPGALSVSPPLVRQSAVGGAIPKVLHHVWLGGRPPQTGHWLSRNNSSDLPTAGANPTVPVKPPSPNSEGRQEDNKMNRNRANHHIVIAVLGMLALAGAGYADIMTYNGLTLNKPVTIHHSSLSGGQMSTRAGQFSVSYQGNDFWAYCVEITQYAGTMDAIEQSITTLPNYQVVGFLIETYGPAATNLSAAALQVAIWEAVFESSSTFDTTVGGFFVDEAPVASAANTLLAAFPGSYTPTAIRLHHRTKQDMLIVPEPASAMLLSCGAFGVLRSYRRKHLRVPSHVD